jgi:uncharacterized membrane protein YcaP (DUF421 family)
MDLASMFFAGWHPLVRILVVGVPTYLLVLAMLHFGGKHSLAKTNAYGLVVTVALGSALASAVLTEQVTLADGVFAIGLLLGLQYLLSTIISRWQGTGRFLIQRPTLLVRHGRLLHEALRRERVTESEVLAAIRKHGQCTLENIGAVVLETDGSFSVLDTLDEHPTALKDVEMNAGCKSVE